MEKRKYAYYILSSEDNDSETYDDYRKALSDYSNRYCATLYGVSEQNDYNVIFSK